MKNPLRFGWTRKISVMLGMLVCSVHAAQANEYPFEGNYSATAARSGSSVTFNFEVDEYGSLTGRFPSPSGASLPLVGTLGEDGMVLMVAGDPSSPTYGATMTGKFTIGAGQSVTGSGDFYDSNGGGEPSRWTGRRTDGAPPTERTLSGRVVNAQGVGVPGVMVKISGSAGGFITDAGGNYRFLNVTPGNYTLNYSREDVTLTPSTRVIAMGSVDTVLTSVVAGFKVSGRVLLPNRVGVAGVRVVRSGSATAVLTNSYGEWSFSNVPSGTVAITSNRAGLTFSPPTQNVRVVTSNVYNVTFSTSYAISGRVVNAAGSGLAGVTITRSAGGAGTVSTTTNATGNYTLTGQPSGSFFITATRAGVTFTPFTQRAILTNGSVTLPNFRAGFAVSGRVVNNRGVALANVRLTRSGSTTAVLTNANGQYTFTDVPSGRVAITPTLSNHTFAPTTQTVNVGLAPLTAAQFVGTPINATRR